ncbi:hypothetical protein CVT26_006486 [Gymnopilus dilepis]|uniref:Ubiquitin 3 binding protein But2 C-terminal domain-containing protein n=1 Tax=Gymnopilus dilepis TaxID=231916 RepID=A0A409W6F0_9AGAR|nr:hypothetical protein CVT26_006486 [Gymnopilus dilepis]
MENVPLRYSDELSDEQDNSKEQYQPAKDLRRGPTIWDVLTRWAAVIVLTTLAIDASCLLYLLSHTSNGQALADLNNLPVRSSYIGLDKLYDGQKDMVAISPIFNLPRPIARVDKSRPTESYPRWEGMMSTGRGMIPYNEMQLILRPMVTSVARFRAIDFGMENCSLTLNIPPRGDQRLLSVSTTDHNPILIDVWRLEDNQVDMDNLTWETKPRRTLLEGTFELKPNSTQYLPGFFCPTSSFHHFELSCRDENCDLHVVATAREPFGLYMTQYQTR